MIPIPTGTITHSVHEGRSDGPDTDTTADAVLIHGLTVTLTPSVESAVMMVDGTKREISLGPIQGVYNAQGRLVADLATNRALNVPATTGDDVIGAWHYRATWQHPQTRDKELLKARRIEVEQGGTSDLADALAHPSSGGSFFADLIARLLEAKAVIPQVTAARDQAVATIQSERASAVTEMTGLRDQTSTLRDQAEGFRDQARDISNIAVPDDVVAVLLNDDTSDTRAALGPALESRSVIDARDYGVKADGVTDDAPAWNALVEACAPGDVITWVGRSVLRSKIVWKTKLSLVGQGRGRSVLASVSEAGHIFSAISYVPGDGASASTPLEDCRFEAFEIDVSGIDTTQASIEGKGIFSQYHRRCQWINLYIHDSIGTGLGVDYLDDCLIHDVVVERCGRNFNQTLGQSGIGIGTGAWEEEATIISNCHGNDNGNFGIFVEHQLEEPYNGRGLIITGCQARGNRIGFGDRGTRGTIFTGNVSHHNVEAGFSASFNSSDGIMAGNLSYLNGTSGIDILPDGPYTVTGNRLFENAGQGIRSNITGTSDSVTGLVIEGNTIERNGLSGIQLDAGSSTGGMRDCAIRGNLIRDNSGNGIYINAPLDGGMICDNRVTNTSGSSQTVGIRLAPGSAKVLANSVIAGNNLVGNTTPLVLSGMSRINVKIRENLGFATAADGSATIPDGAASVTIPHGLPVAPSLVQITKRAAGDAWVSAAGDNNIIITRTGTTGALALDWSASIRL